jgi:maleate isomerase
VLGFACTGTSYLIGQHEERKRIEAYEQRFGFPIVTSSQAILSACQWLGVKRIALLAPYPAFLVDASLQYWTACGLEVVSFARKEMDPTDTRAVYRIRAPMVLEAAAALNVDNADAVLLSGTGMPTLRVMSQLAQRTGRPVLSSNLCLAWAMLKLAGVEPPAARKELGEALLGGWVERAARL